jgi:hypothetical protein
MMTRYWIAAAAIGCVLGAVPVSAEEDPNLRGAQEHLRTAWHNLQAAADDGQGHRDRALGLINKALAELQLVGTGSRRQRHLEQKRTHREAELEQRKEQRDQHLEEKRQQREERIEQR